jgi:hypothetical protein
LHLCLGLPLLPFRFCNQNIASICHIFSCMLHSPPISSLLFRGVLR